MSNIFDFEQPNIAEVFDKERYPMGANIIGGLLYIHCGKPLKDLHVLDAGCGPGQYTEALIELGVGQFTLLDASPRMLDFARQKLKDTIENKIISDVIEAKLPFLPFQDGTFDAVMYNSLSPELTDTVFQASPSLEQYLDLFAKCGFNCITAVNFLSKGTPNLIKNYFDSDGPLKRDWIIGTCAFGNTTDEEVNRILSGINIKDKGSLKKFMLEHDRSSEFGLMTLLVCVSV